MKDVRPLQLMDTHSVGLFVVVGRWAEVCSGGLLTLQQHVDRINNFLKKELGISPDLHSLILLAGDIEQTPESTYPCLVCHRAYSRRQGAVQCTLFQQWVHLSQHCSGLLHTQGLECQPTTQSSESRVPSLFLQKPRPSQSSQPTEG